MPTLCEVRKFRFTLDSKKSESEYLSLFNFGGNMSLRGHMYVKTWINFGWIDVSRSLNRSRILKFEKFPESEKVTLITFAGCES